MTQRATRDALAFMASSIRSGEPWTEESARMSSAAIEELAVSESERVRLEARVSELERLLARWQSPFHEAHCEFARTSAIADDTRAVLEVAASVEKEEAP